MFLFKCGYAGNNFFSFCLSGNIFMSSLFLKDIFTCCIILLGLLFPVISLKMPFHCIDISFVSVWKPVLNSNVLLLLCFQDFFLCLLFPDFSGICLGMNFFIFNLLWVHNTFICIVWIFISWGNLSHYLLNTASASIFSLLWHQLHAF